MIVINRRTAVYYTKNVVKYPRFRTFVCLFHTSPYVTTIRIIIMVMVGDNLTDTQYNLCTLYMSCSYLNFRLNQTYNVTTLSIITRSFYIMRFTALAEEEGKWTRTPTKIYISQKLHS